MQVMPCYPFGKQGQWRFYVGEFYAQSNARLGQHHIDDVGDRLLNIGIVRNRADDGGLCGSARSNAAGDEFSGVDQ